MLKESLKTFIAADKLLQREVSHEYRKACKGDIISKAKLYKKGYEIVHNYSIHVLPEERAELKQLIENDFERKILTELGDSVGTYEYYTQLGLLASQLRKKIVSLYHESKNVDKLNDYLFGGGNIKTPEEIEREDFKDLERTVEGTYD